MSQPVRVELVFPRSGQQVFVQVPAQLASATVSRCIENEAARLARTAGSAAQGCISRDLTAGTR